MKIWRHRDWATCALLIGLLTPSQISYAHGWSFKFPSIRIPKAPIWNGEMQPLYRPQYSPQSANQENSSLGNVRPRGSTGLGGAPASQYNRAKADALILAGEKQLDEKQYRQAAISFMIATVYNQSSARAFNYYGVAEFDLKAYEAAYRIFQNAIRVNPKDAVAYGNMVIAANAWNDLPVQMVISECTASLKLDPTNSTIWGIRGRDYSRVGDNAKAMYDFGQAIKHDPKDADAYHWRGDMELWTNNDKAGYADLRRSRSINPALGPRIAADIKTIVTVKRFEIAQKKAYQRQLLAEREARNRAAARMPAINRVVGLGPAFYQSIYKQSIDDGESQQEAEQKEQAAQDQYNTDVALQEAWDNDDMAMYDNIESGEMSQDEIDNYNPDDSPTNDPNQDDDNYDSGAGGGDDGGDDGG